MGNTLLINQLPKAELHLHIEGTLEPELMFRIAKRNNIELPFSSVEEIRSAYNFSNLQTFLDIYYKGAEVLQTEQDFYDLTWAYLQRAAVDNIRHTEIFFDPQTHTQRGIAYETVVTGIHRALQDADQLNITSRLILCFLRHLSAEDADETFDQALPFIHMIDGIGLDSSELNNPPEDFAAVFTRAREAGLKCVAHAGEEGPPEYIWGALKSLQVSRIDHGVCALEDALLVEYLKENQIPLTVCPLSNLKLKIFETIADNNLLELIKADLCVTVNSDDPAYFGGYLNDNFHALDRALNLSAEQIIQLVKNSFDASFIDESLRHKYLAEVGAYE
ncbi:MAG: adenosine deaminase [bacterium]|nr:adenosine deaminase [bacterium]MCP4801169.1 adenosine deaminase [bacterium]